MMLDYDYMQDTFFNQKLTPFNYKLFVYLLTVIDGDSVNPKYRIKRAVQQEIANGAVISRASVNQGLKRLTEINILIKKDRDYYFNKNLFKS